MLLLSIIGLGLAGVPHPLLFLGMGGLERYVTYPFLLWLLAFGGYLMALVPRDSGHDGTQT